MGGYYSNNVYTITTGTEIVTEIRNGLIAAGWTVSSGVYTAPQNITPMTVTIPTATTALTFANGRLKLTLNNQDVWLASGNSGTGSTSSYAHLELSISDYFFFAKLTGPAASASGFYSATGSPSTYAMITSYTTYVSGVNITDSMKYIIAGSYYTDPGTSTLPSPELFAKYYEPDQSSLQNTKLFTMKAAYEGSAAGYQPPSRLFGGGEITWPYVAISAYRGILGRLNNINFAAPTATITGETAPSKTNLLVDGVRYILTKPFGVPSSSNGSPLGQTVLTTNQNNGVVGNEGAGVSPFSNPFNSSGPFIYIMKGDGT